MAWKQNQDKSQGSPRRYGLELWLSAILSVLLIILLGSLLWPRDYVKRHVIHPTGKTVSVPMIPQKTKGIYSLPLKITPPASMDDLVDLEILIAASGTVAVIKDAIIEFSCCDCRLKTRREEKIAEKRVLSLFPETETCKTIRPGHPQSAELRILCDHPCRISLIASIAESESGVIQVVGSEDFGDLYAYGHWNSRSDVRRVSRLDLLAWAWNLDTSPSWFVAALILAGLLSLIGLIILGRRSDNKSRLGLAAAVFLLTLSLGSVYAILVPPFHAPDEPDHFLSYLRLSGKEGLIEEAKELARRGHFERLKFHEDEFFSPHDMDAPFPVAWGGHVRLDDPMERRSALTVLAWRLIDACFSTHRAPQALLTLRLFNVLIFAFMAAIGGLILAMALPGKTGIFPFFIFVIPTLPFFAMHVSNYALLVHLYTLLGCINLALFLRKGYWSASGLMLGLVVFLLVLTSRNALLIFFWLGTVLAARWPSILGENRLWPRQLKDSGIFWTGLTAGLLGLYFFRDSPQMARDLSMAQDYISTVIPGLRYIFGWLFNPVLLIVTATAAVLSELFLNVLGRRVRDRFKVEWISKTLLALMPIASGLLIFLLAASLFHSFSKLPNFISKNLELGDFLFRTAWGVINGLTFRNPDHFLSVTFWGGFGWHHTVPPRFLIKILAGSAGVGLVLVFWRVWTSRSWKQAVWLLLWFTGVLGSVVLAAAAAYLGGQPNVHGRYLLGPYIILLSICFAGYSLWSIKARTASGDESNPGISGGSKSLIAGTTVCAAIHGLCLLVILHRYFG